MVNEETATARERRRHTRFACDGRAEVVFRPDLLFRGELKDISLTGCYIATRARLNLKRFAEIDCGFQPTARISARSRG
jgi:hypothetical protein